MLAIVLYGELKLVHGHSRTWFVLIYARVVFVLQALSSIAFYALAYRQPVVSTRSHIMRWWRS